nr:hypothetical protein [Methylomarinum sp. Ch1-1]MDP4523144.1 hypothetical protein [Methylomarinum sp. Ch1-1]
MSALPSTVMADGGVSSSDVCSAVRLQAMRKAAEDGTNEIQKVSNPTLDFLNQCIGNINKPTGYSLGIPNIMDALKNKACSLAQDTVGTKVNDLNSSMNYSWSGYGINFSAGTSVNNSTEAANQIWKNMGVKPSQHKNSIGDQNY